jgi:hypothetical protein
MEVALDLVSSEELLFLFKITLGIESMYARSQRLNLFFFLVNSLVKQSANSFQAFELGF